MSDLLLQLCCSGDARKAGEKIAALMAAEGVSVAGAGARDELCPALVLFERPDSETFDLLREGGGRGSRCVLAACLRREALETEAVWRLLEAGAADVFAWDDVERPAAAIAARLRRHAQVEEALASPLVGGRLVGRSPAWVSVLRQIIEAARFTDGSVVLTGESGTGKEQVARLVHALDARHPKGPLVVLDCTTVMPELAGSEFFGHERGAFTHAVTPREGAFALADGGTLFLDEVGELPLTLQAELLRVVQERSYKRVGSNVWRQANFRLVCATNRDLRAMVSRGEFRRDFYFRIAAWTFELPPLRQRLEDVLPLARHFLEEVFAPGPVPGLDPAVAQYLCLRQYPGNVRDLRQLVHRMAKRHVGGGLITVGDLPEEDRQPACAVMLEDWRDEDLQRAVRRALAKGVGLKQLTAETADLAIQIALQEAENNVRRAALKLKITDRALQMRRACGHRPRAGAEADEDGAPQAPARDPGITSCPGQDPADGENPPQSLANDFTA